MIEALTGGERRGGVLADLAIGRMRAARKLGGLSMALAGRFTGTTRCCAACTGTASPASAPRSLTWMSGSRARPRAGSARQTCLRPFPGSGTW